MLKNKQIHTIFILLTLFAIMFLSGCTGNFITNPGIPGIDDTEEADLRVSFKRFDLEEGNFSLEISSITKVGFDGSGFAYTYYDSEGNEISELENYIGMSFEVLPTDTMGIPGPLTTVNDIPLFFNEVENYFIDNSDITEISCTVHLVGTDSNDNELSILIVSDLPIIEKSADNQVITADILTTPDPPEGKAPLTVAFDSTGSWTEDVRGIEKTIWNFGDGDNSDSCCQTHTYTEPGSYIVTLCVADYNGNGDCAATVVNVDVVQDKMTITANPATVSPGEESIISTYITDEFDNPVEGITVTFNTDNGTLSDNFVSTNEDGIAETVLTLNEAVSANVTAYCDNVNGSVTVKAVESLITVTANPATISTGDSSTISAYIVDELGNPVEDGTKITFSTTKGTLTSNFDETTDGIATVDLELKQSGTATVTATYGTLSGSTEVECLDMHIDVVANPATINPGDSSIITAYVTDGNGEPVTDGTNVIFSNSAGSLSATLDATSSGEASVELTLNNEGAAEVTASVGSLNKSVSIICTDYNIIISGNPASILPGNASTITAYLTNSAGEPVPDGTTVSFSTDYGSLSATSAITTDGEATVDLILMQVGDSAKVSAVCPSCDSAQDSTKVNCVDSLYQMTVSANNSTVFPGESSTITAYLTENGEPLVGKTVTFVIATGEKGSISAVSDTTDSSGLASTELTLNQSGEEATVTATYASPSGPVSDSINVTCIENLYQIEVSASAASITPGGISTITAFLTKNGELLEGRTVTFAITTNGSGSINPVSGTTEATGQTGTELILNQPGEEATVTATYASPSGPVSDSIDVVCSYAHLAAGFSYSPESPVLTDQVVQFDATSSVSDCGIVSYEWDYDDTSTGSGKTATHAYATAGTYTVTLTVTDACGNKASATMDVVVEEPTGPQAAILITEIDDNTVYVSGNGSTTGCPGGIVSYEWDWDGGTTTTNGVTSNHAYTSYGNKTISLTVSDDCGNSNTATVTFDLSEPDLLAVAEIVSIDGLTVNVKAIDSTTGCGSADTSYIWSWGDVSANTIGASSGHTYSAAGEYTITLTVTDTCTGITRTSTATVAVELSEPVYTSPVAVMEILDSSDLANGLVNVSGADSTTGCPGGITTFEWDWNYDGTTFNSEDTGATSGHEYTTPDPDPYTVTIALRVTDACGDSTISTAQAIVEVAPEASST